MKLTGWQLVALAVAVLAFLFGVLVVGGGGALGVTLVFGAFVLMMVLA